MDALACQCSLQNAIASWLSRGRRIVAYMYTRDVGWISVLPLVSSMLQPRTQPCPWLQLNAGLLVRAGCVW
jgi:hypothetical protein